MNANQQRTCGACDQPIRSSQRAICTTCEKAAEQLLKRQPELRRELEIEYRREAKKTEQLRVLHNGERPMLFEEKAARLMMRQWSWLNAWVAVCARTEALHAPSVTTVDASAAYLVAALPFLRLREESSQLVNELRQLTIDIVDHIDTPQMLARFAAGPCPQPTDDGSKCPGTIQAMGRRTAPLLQCDRCKAEWDSTQWTTAGRLIMAREDELRRQRELALAITKGAA